MIKIIFMKRITFWGVGEDILYSLALKERQNLACIRYGHKNNHVKSTHIILVLTIWYSQIYPLKKEDVSECVCVFVCYLTPPKRLILMAEIFREDLPWGADGFRLKNFLILPTVRRKTERNTNNILATILCIILSNTTEITPIF